MLVDIIFFLLLIYAFYKGYTQGSILTILSIVGYVLAVTLAFKFALPLHWAIKMGGKWMTILYFILIVFGVVLLVQWLARIIKKGASIIFLGWIDKAAGILLYICFFTMLYGLLMYLFEVTNLLHMALQKTSYSFRFLAYVGKQTARYIGILVPILNDWWGQWRLYLQC